MANLLYIPYGEDLSIDGILYETAYQPQRNMYAVKRSNDDDVAVGYYHMGNDIYNVFISRNNNTPWTVGTGKDTPNTYYCTTYDDTRRIYYRTYGPITDVTFPADFFDSLESALNEYEAGVSVQTIPVKWKDLQDTFKINVYPTN